MPQSVWLIEYRFDGDLTWNLCEPLLFDFSEELAKGMADSRHVVYPNTHYRAVRYTHADYGSRVAKVGRGSR